MTNPTESLNQEIVESPGIYVRKDDAEFLVRCLKTLCLRNSAPINFEAAAAHILNCLQGYSDTIEEEQE
jgi:hypothetical protein